MRRRPVHPATAECERMAGWRMTDEDEEILFREPESHTPKQPATSHEKPPAPPTLPQPPPAPSYLDWTATEAIDDHSKEEQYLKAIDMNKERKEARAKLVKELEELEQQITILEGSVEDHLEAGAECKALQGNLGDLQTSAFWLREGIQEMDALIEKSLN